MKTHFPATLVLHTPNGPEPCCDKHAAALRGVMSMFGANVLTVPAPAGSECANCRNEAQKETAA